jgi:lipopolysaccharide biosynthesis regulator YciM
MGQATPTAPKNEGPQFNRSLWMIEELEVSLESVPDDAERHYGLALIKIMRGKFQEATKSLETAVEAKPEHVRALWLLGEIHMKLGQYEKGAEALEAVVRHEPGNLTAITWLSLAYHSLNKRSQATKVQSILETIAPDLIVSRANK